MPDLVPLTSGGSSGLATDLALEHLLFRPARGRLAGFAGKMISGG